jgi:hypothetical protein
MRKSPRFEGNPEHSRTPASDAQEVRPSTPIDLADHRIRRETSPPGTHPRVLHRSLTAPRCHGKTQVIHSNRLSEPHPDGSRSCGCSMRLMAAWVTPIRRVRSTWASSAAWQNATRPLLGDGRGEEEGVERRAVEAFPGVGVGGDCEQRRPPSCEANLQVRQLCPDYAARVSSDTGGRLRCALALRRAFRRR